MAPVLGTVGILRIHNNNKKKILRTNCYLNNRICSSKNIIKQIKTRSGLTADAVT